MNEQGTVAPEVKQEDQEASIELGRVLFEWRDYTPIPLLVLMILVARPTALSSTIGLLLMLSGEVIRIYSVAFIGSVSRTRSDSTTGGALIRTGPFALVRNPLYVGNFLITVGVAAFTGVPWFVVLTIAMFVFQYHYIVKFEENLLRQKFGDEYDQYRLDVPRWFPKSWNVTVLEAPRNLGPALRSEKRTLTAIALILLVLLFI